MIGIYLEKNVYKMEEVASKEVDALRTLGIKLTLDFDNKLIKVVEDTSEQNHGLCDLNSEETDVVRGMMRTRVMRML